MITFLLVFLTILDIGLLALVLYVYQRQRPDFSLLQDITQERNQLAELRQSVHEELESAQNRSRQFLDKINQIAAEAEMEVKSGKDTLAGQLTGIFDEFSKKLDKPLEEINKKQISLEQTFRKIEREKSLLKMLLSRAEKVCKFFDQRVSVDEVMEELEDKKYTDARKLLTQGISVEQVAKDLGMAESEVRLVSGMVGR